MVLEHTQRFVYNKDNLKNCEEGWPVEWIEANPLPVECENCKEEDCYNCDFAGKRWYLSEADELRVQRKGIEKQIERLKRKISEIDTKLLPFNDEQKAALEGSAEMTYDLFWECLQVCFDEGNMEKYMEIWKAHPEQVAELHRRAKSGEIKVE